MAWDNFGQSWLGVVFNPAGYLLGRKSPSDAANKYREEHPVSSYISGNESELSYRETRQQWTDACASKLKSDDVGKSKSNSLKACEGAWDNDPYAVQVLEGIQNREDEKKQSTENIVNARTAIIFGLVIVLVIVLILFAIKKYRNS